MKICGSPANGCSSPLPDALSSARTLVEAGADAVAVIDAVAALRMARRGALVQQLNAIESLAAVDVTTTAKQGTDASFKPDFKKYNVVVSNYNGANWPEETQAAFAGAVGRDQGNG